MNSLKESFRVMIFMEMRMEMEREGEMNVGRDDNDHEIKIIKIGDDGTDRVTD